VKPAALNTLSVDSNIVEQVIVEVFEHDFLTIEFQRPAEGR
jgi:hypothetical protein